MPERLILLTGATGYVGGRLLERLRGVPLRALSRSGDPFEGVEVVQGDVRDPVAVARALDGVGVAYYLVHALGTGDFGEADREAAQTFADAAREAAIERIVYLGGIGRGELSPHLASRQEVGRILRDSGVQTIELRASIVIGDGSVSFDAFRTLAQLPLTVLPDWVDTPSQPIAVDDVVAYLLEAATVELDGSAVFEIGGADRVPYRAILDELGVATATVPVPGVASSFVTALEPLQPARARIVSDLLESLRNDTSVADRAATDVFSVRPVGLADAIAATRAN